MKFKETVKTIEFIGVRDYTGIHDADIDTSNSYIYIEYELTPAIRNWGLNNIGISINKISGQMIFMIDDDKQLTSPIKNDWEIVNNMEFNTDGAIGIKSVEIDLIEKKISIT